MIQFLLSKNIHTYFYIYHSYQSIVNSFIAFRSSLIFSVNIKSNYKYCVKSVKYFKEYYKFLLSVKYLLMFSNFNEHILELSKCLLDELDYFDVYC